MIGSNPEPKFVNLLRSPGIDSQPVQPYLTYRPARLHRLARENPQLNLTLKVDLRVHIFESRSCHFLQNSSDSIFAHHFRTCKREKDKNHLSPSIFIQKKTYYIHTSENFKHYETWFLVWPEWIDLENTGRLQTRVLVLCTVLNNQISVQYVFLSKNIMLYILCTTLFQPFCNNSSG